MDKENQLPKTILYCLNPRDNEMIASMIGNFQGDGIAGKYSLVLDGGLTIKRRNGTSVTTAFSIRVTQSICWNAN